MATWTPTSEDVHAVIPQRAGGGFTDTTTPTAAQVTTLIDRLQTELEADVGEVPAELTDLARWVVTLGAAYQVELSLFPEQQVDPEATSGLRMQYHHKMGLLRRAIKTAGRLRVGEPIWWEQPTDETIL